MTRSAASALASLVLCLSACTDAGLEAKQATGPATVDDKIELQGRICTQVPGDELFPVKILFLIDTSYTMRVTDPSQQRVTAVNQVLDRYAGNPSVKFAVIAFDAVVTDITQGFTSTPDRAAITGRLDDSDRLTDYQGALGAAYAMLTKDMVESGPAERARTKYVVIFFSDGSPDPQCVGSEMCDPAGADTCPHANAPTPTCRTTCQPDGTCSQPFLHVCNVDRANWPDTFQLPSGTNPNTGQPWTWDDFQGLYPDMDPGKDYNTQGQLVQKVRDIMTLQQIYNVGEIRMHTGLLFDPNIGQAFIDAFCLDRQFSIDLLTAMAQAGNGTFTEFTSGAQINFLNIDYVSIKQVYQMTNLLVSNTNTVPTPTGPMCDSDGDGMPDALEDAAGLCASAGGTGCAGVSDPTDSDGDGYTDAFEDRLRSSGFDPLDPTKPAAPCPASMRGDTDGDGLRDCEEAILGTNPRLFDTDGDRFPDGIEFFAGTDPLRADMTEDADADGLRNGDEILYHWTPVGQEPPRDQPVRYWYQVQSLGETADGRTCYDYDVRDVQLTTTRGVSEAARGANRIDLFFVEGPPDDPRDYGTLRTACVHATYTSENLKIPADGEVHLCEAQFKSGGDPSLTCVAGRGAPCGPPPQDQCGAGLICRPLDCTQLADATECGRHPGCSWQPGAGAAPCAGTTGDGVCVDGCNPGAPCCPGGEVCKVYKQDQDPACGCDPEQDPAALGPDERCPDGLTCVAAEPTDHAKGHCRRLTSQ
jgi:hypothetical protein